METKSRMHLLLMPFVVLVLLSCGSDEKKPEPKTLLISESRYTVPINTDRSIRIESGNQDYSFIVGDNSILNVKYEKATQYSPFGSLQIYGLKKGVTTLTVIDNVTEQSNELEIQVTARNVFVTLGNELPDISGVEPGVQWTIWVDVLDNSILRQGYILVLKELMEPAENNRMCVFESFMHVSVEKALYEGTYTIEKNEDIYTLSLNVVKNDKTATHKYIIRNLSETTYDKMISYLKGEVKEDINFVKESVSLDEDLLDDYKPAYPLLDKVTFTIMNAYMSSY
ncbi:MAG: hypothetical protein GX963_10985 [Bacteroidales bacterium]|nr:hypothetical protein [Bacteroidales bacterium]